MNKNVKIDVKRRDFLKQGLLVGAAVIANQFLTASRGYAQAVKKALVWKNWSGNVAFRPDNMYFPETIEHAIKAILASKKIRASGAAHSYSRIVPEVNLISAQKFKSIKINAEKMEVEAGAGVTLAELIAALVKEGFALPTSGEIDHQTMAGLIATATRGTGIGFGSFSDADQLLGISMIKADGSFLEIDFNDPQYKDIVPALRVSLGAFGFVTAVRFRIVPEFKLKEVNQKESVAEAIKPENYMQNYRYAFYYYPHANKVMKRTQNITSDSYNEADLERRTKKKNLMEDTLGNWLLNVLSHAPSLIPKVSTLFFAQQPEKETAVGRWDKIMIAHRKMRFIEAHHMIPVEMLETAMATVKARSDEFAKRGIYYVDIPMFIRFCRGDKDTLLSPTPKPYQIYAQIEVICHLKQKNAELFLKAIEQDMLTLGSKPHWGKMFYAQVGSLYPGVAEFERLRRQWDPDGKFQNDFVKRNVSSMVFPT